MRFTDASNFLTDGDTFSKTRSRPKNNEEDTETLIGQQTAPYPANELGGCDLLIPHTQHSRGNTLSKFVWGSEVSCQ